MRRLAATTEYRVIWKRKGARPKSRRFAGLLSAQRYALILGPEPWRGFTHGETDPDLPWCCSGYHCSCQGQTVRERHEELVRELPPVEWGPRIERRRVAPWEAVPA